MAFTLPSIPSQPVDVEDSVAALFHASGYHVHRNIVQSDPDNVLELDVVATDYRTTPPRTILAEAKSGDWGYAECFKVVGWMRYLGLPSGTLLVSQLPAKKNPEVMNARMEGVGLRIVHLGNDPISAFTQAGFAATVDAMAYEVSRFLYAIERGMVKYLTQQAKVERDRRGPRTLLDQYRLVNDKLFFEPNEYERLQGLYAAFMEHPKLALGIARELAGEPFDCEKEDPNNQIVKEAIYEGKHDLMQVCFYLQHRARLAVLKAAVDLVAGASMTPPQFQALPTTFRQGLAELGRHSAVRHYARFWQVFLWTFGGFYLLDRQEAEFRLLANLTQVPVEEVEKALAVFDLLFPTGGGWFGKAYNTKLRVVKLVPTPMQGIGAFHRMRRYEVDDYAKLGYKDYTGSDLAKWHGAGYEWLKRHSHLKEGAGTG